MLPLFLIGMQTITRVKVVDAPSNLQRLLADAKKQIECVTGPVWVEDEVVVGVAQGNPISRDEEDFERSFASQYGGLSDQEKSCSSASFDPRRHAY